jgi:hypothetical protein
MAVVGADLATVLQQERSLALQFPEKSSSQPLAALSE